MDTVRTIHALPMRKRALLTIGALGLLGSTLGVGKNGDIKEMVDDAKASKDTAELRQRVNDLMDGYKWKYKDIEDTAAFDWDSKDPMQYSYKPGTSGPFSGVCLEQAKYIKDHIPNTKILFRELAGGGVNYIHAAPVINNRGKLMPVYLTGRPYEQFENNYLGKEGFDNPNDVIINQLPRRRGEDRGPFDFYWLDDIPDKGDAASLRRYAKEHGVPVKVRNKRILDPERSRYKKNFDRIVKEFKDRYGIDLSNVRFDLDTLPRYDNGDVANIPVDRWGGSWLKNHSIVINNNMRGLMRNYKAFKNKRKAIDWIIAHELGHDIYHNKEHKGFVKKYLDEAKKQNFTTEYLKSIPKKNLDKEMFPEYMAYLLNQKKK